LDLTVEAYIDQSGRIFFYLPGSPVINRPDLQSIGTFKLAVVEQDHGQHTALVWRQQELAKKKSNLAEG